MSDTLTLNCWVRSAKARPIIQIDISKTASVCGLQKAIKNDKPVAFRDWDADALTLYKPKHPLSEPHEDKLRELILSEHAERLMGIHRLSRIFTEQPPEDDIHIIVDAATEIVCYLRGATLHDSFPISIQQDERIRQFIPRILASPNFNIANQPIRLYKISGDQNRLQECLDKIGDGALLQQSGLLMPNFLDVPVLDALRIVVEIHVPFDAQGCNRPLRQPSSRTLIQGNAPIQQARKYFLENNLNSQEQLSPSQRAVPKTFRQRQHNETKVIPCGRPLHINDRIPIPLLECIFGEFVDDSKNIKTSARDNQLTRKLAFTMSTIYDTEKDRAAEIRDVLAEFDLHCVVSKARNTDHQTDGSISTQGHTYVLVEFKNEVGSGGGEPYFQNIEYYLESTKNTALKMLDSTLPCLLLCIFGPYMVFAGAAWNLRPTAELLSMPIAFHINPTNNESFLVLARHMVAFRKAAQALERHYGDLERPILTSAPQIFPYPTSYISRIVNTSKEIKYREQPTTNRLIFFGFEDSESGSPICIKFARRYSPEAHDYCTSLGCAPVLRGFKTVPGGWFMVVMDDIRAGYRTLCDAQASNSTSSTAHWKTPIAAKLAEFHKAGFVHGDIRHTNIMVPRAEVDGEDFKVIDFDWSGRVNDVVYPPLVNREIWRPDGAIDGEPILATHDMDMLDGMWNSRQGQ